jgi:hypothetical protein
MQGGQTMTDSARDTDGTNHDCNHTQCAVACDMRARSLRRRAINALQHNQRQLRGKVAHRSVKLHGQTAAQAAATLRTFLSSGYRSSAISVFAAQQPRRLRV